MKIIDADKLHYKQVYIQTEKGLRPALVVFAKEIRKMPEIVRCKDCKKYIIKHGHWRERDFGLICSECNHYTETMYDEPFNNEFGKGWALKRPYYCGYCGARMDEVKDETD